MSRNDRQVDSPWNWVSEDLSQDTTVAQVLGRIVGGDYEKDLGSILAAETYKTVNMEDETKPKMIELN